MRLEGIEGGAERQDGLFGHGGRGEFAALQALLAECGEPDFHFTSRFESIFSATDRYVALTIIPVLTL
ncbi:MAG: hypothetical protein ACR2PL_17625 [Dehalococcoidia bacterium]